MRPPTTLIALAPLLAGLAAAGAAPVAALPDPAAGDADAKASLLAGQTFCISRLQGASDPEARAAAELAVFPKYEPILSRPRAAVLGSAIAYARQLCPFAFPGEAVRAARAEREAFRRRMLAGGLPALPEIRSVKIPSPQCFEGEPLIRAVRAGATVRLPECGKEFNPSWW